MSVPAATLARRFMPGRKTVITLGLFLGSALLHGQESIDAILAAEDPALQEIEAQIQAQEYDYPILWLEQQIEAVERASHRYNPELVRPLTLLGDALAGNGDYSGALDNYGRAVHLSRVNDGLHSSSQIAIVYREATIHKTLGDYALANDREEYAFSILSRVYGPYDEKLLPGVYHLAEWYGETNNVFSARALYQHAVNILQANSMQSSLDAIRAYQGIARTYRVERFPTFYTSGDGGSSQSSSFTPAYSNTLSVNNFPAGERALQQIIKIHRESENPDPKVLAEAMLELADWYLLFDKTRRAFPLYQHVYTLLAEAKGFAVEQYFAEPKLLYFPVPQDPRAPPLAVRGELQQGFVEVAYEASTNGYAKSMKTVGSEPDGLMDFRVRKSLRLSRYRPALVDGVPMAKLDHTFRHVFGYFPKIAADATDGSAKTAEGE